LQLFDKKKYIKKYIGFERNTLLKMLYWFLSLDVLHLELIKIMIHI